MNSGDTIIVSPEDDLKSKIENAPDGSQILVLEGTHYVSEPIRITANNLLIIGEEGSVVEGKDE